VAALDDATLASLLKKARDTLLDVLVEAHDEAEVKRAIAVGAEIIGINNRDLRTFTVDRELAIRLRPTIPADRIVVAESGIRDAADVARLRDAGVDAMLVGETLMRAPDPAAALRGLLADSVGG
jgi:indole-3-glycerol phosphate synthase